jgi:hypothetical protein
MTRSTAGPVIFLAFVALYILAQILAPPARTAWRRFIAALRARRGVRITAVFAVFATAFLAFVFGLWWIEIHWMTPQGAQSQPTEGHFWIQVFLGRWVPNASPYESVSFWFSLSVGVAVTLGLGLYVGLFELWRKVTRIQREATMRRIDMLLGRD